MSTAHVPRPLQLLGHTAGRVQFFPDSPTSHTHPLAVVHMPFPAHTVHSAGSVGASADHLRESAQVSTWFGDRGGFRVQGISLGVSFCCFKNHMMKLVHYD